MRMCPYRRLTMKILFSLFNEYSLPIFFFALEENGKKKKQLVHAQVTALPLWRFTHVSAVHLMIRGRCSAHLNGHLPISPSRPFSQTNQHDQHYQRHSILPIFFQKYFPTLMSCSEVAPVHSFRYATLTINDYLSPSQMIVVVGLMDSKCILFIHSGASIWR